MRRYVRFEHNPQLPEVDMAIDILYCMELNISLVVVSIPLLKPLLRSKEGENNRGSESEKESSAAIY